MKSTLEFTTITLQASELGLESPLPDLLGSFNIQNRTDFFLDEDDEIFEGYGKRSTCYPYRRYRSYNRTLHRRPFKAAILENDWLEATFLPELGGRLWSLVDKSTGKNLLYTNDVLRPSNLAVRDAWFSGGVEWNIGVIGHTPLTCEPLFTALLSDSKGNPVLRMYEYERIRDVEYQMDFWLGEQDRFLNCRMRIVNSTGGVVPMYWWSNMAVPEQAGGRIAVPASTAYTNRGSGIYKVAVPMVDGVDISHYCDIPAQVDYFFNIPHESDKFIAALDAQGYGLLHLSTSRLQSRKLFSWGHADAGDRWQEYLTDKAGPYLEIQAGLGKTQYGCIPMPPHTAWEWVERYGPVDMGEQAVQLPFAQLCAKASAIASAELTVQNTEQLLLDSRSWAKTKGTLVYKGSGYGALAGLCRGARGEKPLSEHLDFGGCGAKQQPWAQLLETGVLPEPAGDCPPEDFTLDPALCDRLRGYADTEQGAANWYAQYQLGVLLLGSGETQEAGKRLQAALKLKDTPWTRHALAVLALCEDKPKEAADEIQAGLLLLPHDLPYLKEAFDILERVEADKQLMAHYDGLSAELRADSRLLFGYIKALHRSGRSQEAYSLLTAGEGLELDDLRECDLGLGDKWKELHRAVFGQDAPIPHRFNFNTL